MNEHKVDPGWLAAGMAVGAAVMYLLDPELGTSRRALARDKMNRTRRKTRDAAEATARDLSNRAKGIAAETWSRLRGESVNDDVLEERVRAKLGFLVRHPAAIDVEVAEGRVTLGGAVLADEAEQLLHGVRSVRGVVDVIDRLEVHHEADDVPELQGNKPKPSGDAWDIMQSQWSPATRFLIGIASIGLIAYAIGASRPAIRGRNRAPMEDLPSNPPGAPNWLG